MIRLTYFAALIALTASLTLNVIYLQSRVEQSPRPRFAAGMKWPLMRDAKTNEPVRISRETMVYVFSPKCSWSIRDYPNLVRIGMSQSTRAIVGLVLTDDLELLGKYLERYPFPGGVATIATTDLPPTMASHFRITPQWVVLSDQGRVVRSWEGAVLKSRRSETLAFFGVQLPGISDRSDGEGRN